MKAYIVKTYKRPMQAGEAAEPAVGERDVLVEIHAAPPRPGPLFDKQIRKINGMT